MVVVTVRVIILTITIVNFNSFSSVFLIENKMYNRSYMCVYVDIFFGFRSSFSLLTDRVTRYLFFFVYVMPVFFFRVVDFLP